MVPPLHKIHKIFPNDEKIERYSPEPEYNDDPDATNIDIIHQIAYNRTEYIPVDLARKHLNLLAAAIKKNHELQIQNLKQKLQTSKNNFKKIIDHQNSQKNDLKILVNHTQTESKILEFKKNRADRKVGDLTEKVKNLEGVEVQLERVRSKIAKDDLPGQINNLEEQLEVEMIKSSNLRQQLEFMSLALERAGGKVEENLDDEEIDQGNEAKEDVIHFIM